MSQHLLNLIRKGETAEVAAALQADPTLAWSRDAQGVSMLMLAIYSGQPAIRDLLVTRLQLSGAPGLDLFEASALGDCARLRRLLDPNVMPVYETSADGWTALHLAAAFGGAEATALLLQHGAHVHQIGHNALRNQPLHACLALSRDLETAQLLLAAGANVNFAQAGGYTPLHQAAASGNLDLVHCLLDAGADPTRTDDQGRTPAGLAAERNHPEIAALLTRERVTRAAPEKQ